jgi:polysaccharide biosynthesis transport protein
MKDKPFDSSGNAIAQIQGAAASGLYEPRQNEGISMRFVLASLLKYWYVSLLVSGLMMAGIAHKTYKQPKIYKSGFQIAINLKSTASFAEKLAASANNATATAEERTTTIDTITQILKSKAILQKAIDILPPAESKPSADEILQDLTIQAGQSTDILSVNYTGQNPQQIVEVLNALGKVYIDYSIKSRKIKTDQSIVFIESQLPESRKRLETSAQEVEEFRQKYKFFDPESSSKGLAEYRQDINAKINDNRVQYSQTERQYAELKKQLNKVGLNSNGNLSTTMLTQDSAYQELFKKLNELELVYSQERVRLSDNNPIVENAKEKRDRVLGLLKNRAQQVLNRSVSDTELTNGGISNFSNSLAQNFSTKQIELENILASQAAQYQSLSQLYERIELQIAQLPTLQKQYTELQRRYNLHSQELTAFLQKLQELKIADAEQVVPWNLLDPPDLPDSPISPDVKRQLGLGGLASLLAGTLVAVGLNKVGNRIEDPDVIKSITGLSVLAIIPNVNKFEQLAAQDMTFFQSPDSKNHAQWSFLDSIRNLALGIGLTSGHRTSQIGKVLAITSALPKEGKSTIAFYTSITLADLGYRTLLVDADLYNSAITQLCQSSQLFESADLNSPEGLSDVLLQNDKWEKTIKKSPFTKLDVLLTGSQSINSILLLNSPDFNRLVEQWRNEYDYVIFDTPCLLGVSDTRLIGSLMDALIFVVNMNAAKPESIDRALDTIASTNTPILGLVVNQVKDQYSDHSKYRRSYQKNDSKKNDSTSETKK